MRRDVQGAVVDGVEGELLDVAEAEDVRGLRVALHGHHPGVPGADQHHGGRYPEQAVRRDRVDRAQRRPELVGGVLVEDRGALQEVLGHRHEGVDVLAGVDAGVVVGPRGGLEGELLVRDAGGDRSVTSVPHADDGDPVPHERRGV
jgi:hypothetical protein